MSGVLTHTRGMAAVKAAMAVVCFVFVVLCVRSFIKARRAGAAQRDS